MKKLFLLAIILLSLFLLFGGVRNRTKTPRHWQVLDGEADRAFQNYEIEKARRCWQRSIEKNPRNLKAYSKLGIAYMLIKEYDKAIDILRKGLSIDGENLGLNYNLALAYYYSGDNKRTLEQLEIVSELNSEYPEANYLKGLCLENMGRIEEARQAYIEELNNNPGSTRAWKKVRRNHHVAIVSRDDIIDK